MRRPRAAYPEAQSARCLLQKLNEIASNCITFEEFQCVIHTTIH